MTILVLGAASKVGRAIVARAGGAAAGLTRSACDVTDRACVAAALAEYRPRLVVNAAAYTAVDRAESEPEAAMRTNGEGARLVAEATAAAGIPVLHLSTDYVFDGAKPGPYVEDDAPAPLGAYGASKAAGDAAVAAANPRHLVLRVSWLFAGNGRSFVTTILRLAAEGRALRVVDDQRGGPTAAADVADAVLRIDAALADGFDGWGVYHFTGAPVTTWYGFARAIVDRRPGAAVPVVPIATADWPTPARRPANSMLDGGRLRRALGIGKPDWRAALDRALAEIEGGTG